MLYGKLEVYQVIPDEKVGIEEPKLLHTIEDFDDIKEFKVDKWFQVLSSNAEEYAINHKTDFIMEHFLLANDDDLIISIAKWAKANIDTAKDMNLINAFQNFIGFYLNFSAYRQSLKKNA